MYALPAIIAIPFACNIDERIPVQTEFTELIEVPVLSIAANRISMLL